MLQTPSNKTLCPEGKGSLASSSENVCATDEPIHDGPAGDDVLLTLSSACAAVEL